MRDAKLGSGAIQVGGNGSGGVVIGKPGSGGVVIEKPDAGSGGVTIQKPTNGTGTISIPGDNTQQQSGGTFTRNKQSVQAFFEQYGVRLP